MGSRRVRRREWHIREIHADVAGSEHVISYEDFGR
jgi:hypothetical protein